MPEEVWLFGRASAFGLLVGAGYAYLSHELVGTVLLVGFGLATGLGFVLLRRGARAKNGKSQRAGAEGGVAPLQRSASRDAAAIAAGAANASATGLALGASRELVGEMPPAAEREAVAAPPVAFTNEPEGAFGDEGGAVPRGSLVPFWVGVGVATCVLGLVLNVWLAVVGLLPLLIGAVGWIRSVGHELDQVERDR